MFGSIRNGWELVKESIRVFNHHPKLIVPLLVTWLIYAPVVLYLKYWFDWDVFTTQQAIAVILGVIFVFAFLLTFSCSMLLELVQQLESKKNMDIGAAFLLTIGHNLIRMLPLVIVWTVLWFLLTLLQAIFSKRRRKSGSSESFSFENSAKTLAGYGRMSVSRSVFFGLKKGVRMIIFLILPGIAWENLNFFQATKKGLAIFRTHLAEFLVGFAVTEGVALLIFFVPGMIFYITGEMEIALPDYVWTIVIIYIGFGWSYLIYLEQMFAAELYLWNTRWEKAFAEAQAAGGQLPRLSDVPRPSILDEVGEFVDNLS